MSETKFIDGFISKEDQISILHTKNKALLEALEDWNKSFKSVLDHGVYFDNNVFTLFNQRYVQSEKAIAEAIQGEPPTYGINPVKDGVLKFKNQDGTGKE